MIDYHLFKQQTLQWAEYAMTLINAHSYNSYLRYSLYVNNKFDLKATPTAEQFDFTDYADSGISAIFNPRNKTYDEEKDKVIESIDPQQFGIFVCPLNLAAWMTTASLNSELRSGIITLNPKMIERVHKVCAEVGFMHFSSKLNKKGTIFARSRYSDIYAMMSKANDIMPSRIFPSGISSKKKQMYIDEQMEFQDELFKLSVPTLRSMNTQLVTVDRELTQVRAELESALERHKEKSTEQSTTPVILTWT